MIPRLPEFSEYVQCSVSIPAMLTLVKTPRTAISPNVTNYASRRTAALFIATFGICDVMANALLRAVHTGCVCVTSWTWNNFYHMRLMIRQFCSERTWTLQKSTHPSPKVTCLPCLTRKAWLPTMRFLPCVGCVSTESILAQ